jgi:hypothetical protein
MHSLWLKPSNTQIIHLHSALGIANADPYGMILKWAKESNEVNKPEVTE